MGPRIRRLYWQATALALAAHFGGWPGGLAAAIALNAVQALHFVAWRRSVAAFDVQVRLGFLALLLAGTQPGAWPLHVLQFAGVNALLVADYCLLARLLVLLPWNRRVPLTPALVRWAIFSPPAAGAITDRVPG